MSGVTDRDLRAWLVDALEPPRRLEVERLLAADPALAARLASLELASELNLLETSWSMPPPGLGALSGATVAVMAGQAQGAWVRLRLPAEVPEDSWVLVLERVDGLWTVTAPRDPDELVRAGELPLEEDARQLDLAPGAGADRIGAVLVPAGWTVDWSLPDTVRWGELLEASFLEGWPSGTVDVPR